MTEEEIDFIFSNYPNLTISQIANKLGRKVEKVEAIIYNKSYEGIKKPKKHFRIIEKINI